MEFKFLLSFLLMINGSIGNELSIINNCSFPIWPGIQGKPGKAHYENGGFELAQNETKIINTSHDWAGKIWARTNCDESGKCETGDCGNKIQCNGTGGVPPVTYAELTVRGWALIDYYHISLVDGYNLPIRMTPTGGYKMTNGDEYDCTSASCHTDLNTKCPTELAVNNSDGSTIACKSACVAFDTDEYCCRGAYDSPQRCKSKNWPFNYPPIFKSACPSAYIYDYDNTPSLFACKGNFYTSYDIVFCP
ncbi:pathogenesis-related thaumatin-like protein 3.5 [Aphidius gifuensis]|uniref:pathogenesis-related thaumatin-like protein 3.5 n=1 Tax=Aphidius gifuensis TaxID=684658 RepID=UPI001CDBCAD6|nr:pathogenesis-related thaumatin-like protein 3.5 [Aphidius gifuensis]